MSLLFGSGTLVDKRAIPRKGRGRATIAGPISISRGCARLATPAREFVPQGLPQSEHDYGTEISALKCQDFFARFVKVRVDFDTERSPLVYQRAGLDVGEGRAWAVICGAWRGIVRGQGITSLHLAPDRRSAAPLPRIMPLSRGDLITTGVGGNGVDPLSCHPFLVRRLGVKRHHSQRAMTRNCRDDVGRAPRFRQSPTRGFPKTVRRRLRGQVCLPAPLLEPMGEVVGIEWTALPVGEERQAINGSRVENFLKPRVNRN